MIPLFVLSSGAAAIITALIAAATTAGGMWFNQKRKTSKAQQEQNAFNSAEAALQRDWSSQEAERARDWNEEMYYKYNSLSGKIQQAEQAGVNPMFAVTGNSVSPAPVSSGVPSGAAASSSGGSSPYEGFTALVGQLAGLAKLKSDIELNEAKAEKELADAEKSRVDTNVSLQKLPKELANLESSTAVNWQSIQESVTNVEKIRSDIGLNQTQAELWSSQMDYLFQQTKYLEEIREPSKRKAEAEALYTEWLEKNKTLFKSVEIGTDVLNIAADLGATIINGKFASSKPLVIPEGGTIYRP